MSRWTEEQYSELMRQRAGRIATAVVAPKPSDLTLGRLPAGTMNNTEAAYDAHLQMLHRAGEIIWHKFEHIKLRLADKTFLTVDFAVLPASGLLELREVKGFFRDDAKVKIKVAASMYPFKFILVRRRPKRDGGGWIETEVN